MFKKRKSETLLAAVADGQINKVKSLLDHKADLNAQSDNGRTALMSAAFRGLKDTFALLLDNGAD
ncbi:ankyrin repeat domain-containing protein [Gemmatimonadota bacterium]